MNSTSEGHASPETRWNPEQYLKFAGQRLRPALELAGRIDAEPGVVVDLGCGAGEVTRHLASRWPSAQVVGVDHSREMLTRASAEPSNVKWTEADIRGWAPDRAPDVIFSNAALHWVEDHEAVFPRLFGMLPAGGVLAVQMPLSWNAPSHRLMRETLATGGANGAMLGDDALRSRLARRPVGRSEAYYDLLAQHAQSLDIWETEYLQVLEGEDPVLEWVTGTGLRPVLAGLGDTDRATFLVAYRRRLREAYPERADGRTVYPFRRLFIVAVRGE